MCKQRKHSLWLLLTIFLFTSLKVDAFYFLQKDTIPNAYDSNGIVIDTNYVKDTLLIQYKPVIPRSFLEADARFIQNAFIKSNDSIPQVLNYYKNFFNQTRFSYQLYNQNIAIANTEKVVFKIEQRFSLPDKDFLFYMLLGLLAFIAFILNIYPSYLPKLFSQFSQSSLRMLQFREQLLQNSMASLVMNICFLLSFSLFANLIIFNGHFLPIDFWEGYGYLCAFFTFLYLGKYLCLKLAGYIFNTQDLVNTYLFLVFMINKILGILLIPFILILGFAKPIFHSYAIWVAGVLIILLMLYRYLFSLTSVRNKLHISSFHFFLYLCAFEIMPLLLLYKLVIAYFGGTF